VGIQKIPSIPHRNGELPVGATDGVSQAHAGEVSLKYSYKQLMGI
jgi:hypothetical protein